MSKYDKYSQAVIGILFILIIFVFGGKTAINIKNEKYKLDERPIEPGCQCPACRSFSRAYIRHLFAAGEMLGMRLAVLHNLWFYNRLAAEIRAALDEGRYEAFYREKRELLDRRI